MKIPHNSLSNRFHFTVIFASSATFQRELHFYCTNKIWWHPYFCNPLFFLSRFVLLRNIWWKNKTLTQRYKTLHTQRKKLKRVKNIEREWLWNCGAPALHAYEWRGNESGTGRERVDREQYEKAHHEVIVRVVAMKWHGKSELHPIKMMSLAWSFIIQF